MSLVIKSLVREVSDNSSVGCDKGRDAEVCSFSGFSLSACIIFYFAFQMTDVINNRIFFFQT